MFSEQLGYPIIPADLGLAATDEHEVGLRYCDSIAATVVAVAEFGRCDMRRRGLLQHGTFLAVATIAPSHDWLLAVLEATEPRAGSRIGEHQVSVIREAFADFLEADTLYGGGHARRALTEYVTGRVLPMLQDVDPASATGATLFAAAEQTMLLGAMAIDDDRQALGQRYLIQALRLAEESGDAALGAAILVDMSDQARMLGYPREALQLARTGRHGLARAFSPACASILLALEAKAHAVLGDSAAAVRAIMESERVFDRVDPETEPVWAKFRLTPYRTITAAREFDEHARDVRTQAYLN